jgi:hypothetical protein
MTRTFAAGLVGRATEGLAVLLAQGVGDGFRVLIKVFDRELAQNASDVGIAAQSQAGEEERNPFKKYEYEYKNNGGDALDCQKRP